jgi:hypothetical protein
LLIFFHTLIAMYFIDTEAREIRDKKVEEEDEDIEWEDERFFGEDGSEEREDESDEKKRVASSRRKLVKGKRRLRKIQDEDSDDLGAFEFANNTPPDGASGKYLLLFFLRNNFRGLFIE